uniref:Uncharacterized protein n=1 Tax=Anguilla anguilla TaxID=7936 RepID=A0A0E9WYX5_ANGAN
MLDLTHDPADQWCHFITRPTNGVTSSLTQSQTFAFVGLAPLLRSSQKLRTNYRAPQSLHKVRLGWVKLRHACQNPVLKSSSVC